MMSFDKPGLLHTMPAFIYCLNSSTIKPTPILDKIRIAGEVGYRAIELWHDDIDAHLARGGSLREIRKAVQDHGLDVPTTIFLKGWWDTTGGVYDRALEETRRRLGQAAALPSADLRERVEHAASVLTDLGGLAEVEEVADGYLIRGFSCPLDDLTAEHPRTCHLAEALVSELFSPQRPALRVIPVSDRRAERLVAIFRFLLLFLALTEYGRWLVRVNEWRPSVLALLGMARDVVLVLFAAGFLAGSGLFSRLAAAPPGTVRNVLGRVLGRWVLPLAVLVALGAVVAAGLGYDPLALFLRRQAARAEA